MKRVTTWAARLASWLPGIFLGIFAWIYGRDAMYQMTSNDYWFKVDQMLVMDAEEGTQPRMSVIRQINKPFLAEWVATVRRLDPDGLTLACVGDGKSHYIPEGRLPLNMNLEWWVGKKCDLQPGRYQVDTKWILEIPGYGDRRVVEVRSNIFTIQPKT